MAKDSVERCSDCYREDLTALFGGKGNGECSHCQGTGKDYSAFNALIGTVLTDDDGYSPCKACSGTGQCQTCGGTGYRYYNEEVVNTSDNSNNSNNSSGYNDTYSPSGNSSSTSDEASTFLGCVTILVVGAIIIAISGKFTNNHSTRNNNHSTRNKEEVYTESNTNLESNETKYYEEHVPENEDYIIQESNKTISKISYPDENQIKNDILHIVIYSPCSSYLNFHFTSLAVFQSIKINNYEPIDNDLYIVIFMEVVDLRSFEKENIKALVKYTLFNWDKNRYSFNRIDAIAFYKDPVSETNRNSFDSYLETKRQMKEEGFNQNNRNFSDKDNCRK